MYSFKSATYDEYDRLTSKTDARGITLTYTDYYVNGTSSALSQVVAESDATGSQTVFYTRNEDIFSMEKGDKVCYDLYDRHGGGRILTNTAGLVTDRYNPSKGTY